MTTASFTVYSSPTLNAGTIGQPAGVSLACLTCHDGTLAVDAYNGNTGNPAHKITSGSAYLGTTLNNDHPISFTYDASLATADGSLKTPDNANGNVGTAKLPLYGVGKNQLECASCHDPHKTTHGNYLRISNASSALCTQCHSK